MFCKSSAAEAHLVFIARLQVLFLSLEFEVLMGADFCTRRAIHTCTRIDIPHLDRYKVRRYIGCDVVDTHHFGEGCRPGVAWIRELVGGIDESPRCIVRKMRVDVQNQFAQGNQIQSRDRLGIVRIRCNQLVRTVQGLYAQDVLLDEDKVEGRYSVEVVFVQLWGYREVTTFAQVDEGVATVGSCSSILRSSATQGDAGTLQVGVAFSC